MAKIRVLLADDHLVVLSGLRMLIDAQPDMEVVAIAGDCRTAMEQVRQSCPQVITVDLNMPGGGLKLLEQLRETAPGTRSLVLTMHGDDAYCRAALAAGATGFLVKTAADTQLLNAIRAVAKGRVFVDSGTADGETTRSGPPDGLSPREMEVLVHLAHGLTNQAVADRLLLSVKTVETYRARIAEKLGLRTRADIVRYAIELGLLTGDGSPPKSPAP